jgi:hypothetical protein
MNDHQVEFLPFHAINEFMVDDYRQNVLHTVLGRMSELSPAQKGSLASQIKRHVSVQGFRNSSAAPLLLKIKGATTAFQRHPDFAARVLQTWADLNPDLRQQVFDLLTEREWQILPINADRAKLPGFLTDWPEAETYDVLDQAYSEKYPDSTASENDVRLMIVWIGNRLPYPVTDTDNEDTDEEETETDGDQAGAEE